MWIRFSASVPGSEGLISDCTQDFEPLAASLARSAWWRGKPSPPRSWERRCRKGGWMNVLSGAEISETYPATNFRRSTGSPAAIPASHSPTLASEWEKTTIVICGPQSSTSSELFDQAESSSRTSPGTCRSASIASFKTWRDAITAARSDCSRRRKSAHPTDASESSSLGWPTPTSTANQTAPSMRKHPGCRAFWPTPDAMIGNRAGKANDPEAWEQHRAKHAAKGVNAQFHLGVAVNWPTPTARDHKDGDGTADVPTNGLLGRAAPRDPTSHPGQLNPDWVEMLMGFQIGWTDCGH